MTRGPLVGRHYPAPPEGVRLRYHDGTCSDVLPVLYIGRDEDGIDLWEAMAPDERRPEALTASSIPPRSSVLVGFSVAPPDADTSVSDFSPPSPPDPEKT